MVILETLLSTPNWQRGALVAGFNQKFSHTIDLMSFQSPIRPQIKAESSFHVG
jgi:hypothetical protein